MAKPQQSDPELFAEFQVDPETLDTVRAYRDHVKARQASEKRKYRRSRPRGGDRVLFDVTRVDDWTEVLSLDWTVAGPRYSGFPHDQWARLQQLRNAHGPAILSHLDELLDGDDGDDGSDTVPALVDENGVPTVAGAEAMFAAIDEARANANANKTDGAR